MDAEPRLRNIRLAVTYRGTSYGGWQRQPNATTVQELVEEAVRRVTGERAAVIASGRTDAGVHALGQVANFKKTSRLEAAVFVGALNAYLPADVAVLASEEAPLEFNARSSAKRKTYRYLMWRSAVRPVVWAGLVCHLKRPMDARLMAEAARHFVGRLDFASLATELDRSKDTVREVYEAAVQADDLACVGLPQPLVPKAGSGVAPEPRQGELVSFTVTANGFLYNMVRTMVGTLIEVGRGRRPPDDVQAILESRDRRLAGPTAPPEGLWLVGVEY